jgi:hypothetical protein
MRVLTRSFLMENTLDLTSGEGKTGKLCHIDGKMMMRWI